MNARLAAVWGIIALAFALLLTAAVAWDAVRGLRVTHRLVVDNDREIRLQEERFLSNLAPVGVTPEDVRDETARFRQAQSRTERESVFQELIVRIGSLKPIMPGDPVARRAADEYAGALNRRQVALRRYQEAATEYNAASQTWTGRLARCLSKMPEQADEY